VIRSSIRERLYRPETFRVSTQGFSAVLDSLHAGTKIVVMRFDFVFLAGFHSHTPAREAVSAARLAWFAEWRALRVVDVAGWELMAVPID
jgi:hypothetical protein